MTFPPATRKDHEKFCVTEGWSARTTATGTTGTHHANYELALPDGRILYTRISHPVNRDTYGRSLWSHVLREQLEVSADEFWACVREGVTPLRGPTVEPASAALPLEVVALLVGRFHIPEGEVRAMTKEEAVARLAEEFSKPAQ